MIPKLLISTSITKRKEEAEKLLKSHNLTTSHPNLIWIDEEEKLGIEQIRKIKEHLNLKPYQGRSQATVLVNGDNLTTEAQNALLKLLEEPPGESLIIIGVSSEEKILSTILSRCSICYLKNDGEKSTEVEKYFPDIEKLLSLPYDKRFQFVEKLEDKEAFLLSLTAYFRSQMLHIGGVTKNKDFLRDLIEAQRWANQNVNIRMILEYLMLKMPYENVLV